MVDEDATWRQKPCYWGYALGGAVLTPPQSGTWTAPWLSLRIPSGLTGEASNIQEGLRERRTRRAVRGRRRSVRLAEEHFHGNHDFYGSELKNEGPVPFRYRSP